MFPDTPPTKASQQPPPRLPKISIPVSNIVNKTIEMDINPFGDASESPEPQSGLTGSPETQDLYDNPFADSDDDNEPSATPSPPQNQATVRSRPGGGISGGSRVPGLQSFGGGGMSGTMGGMPGKLQSFHTQSSGDGSSTTRMHREPAPAARPNLNQRPKVSFNDGSSTARGHHEEKARRFASAPRQRPKGVSFAESPDKSWKSGGGPGRNRASSDDMFGAGDVHEVLLKET